MKLYPLDDSASGKVIALENTGDQYRVIVQISTKYRGSFNTLAFWRGETLQRLSKRRPAGFGLLSQSRLRSRGSVPSLDSALTGVRSPAFAQGYGAAGRPRKAGVMEWRSNGVSITDYVATIQLLPVTDANQTYAQRTSEFSCPANVESDMMKLYVAFTKAGSVS
jgi:hypothetical protein